MSCSEICDLAVSAKNDLHGLRGFSPNQWAFGQGRGRVESFLQNGEVPTVQNARADSTFEEQIQRRNAARQKFLEQDSKRRIQRALLRKQRKSQEFEIGQLVFFFRRARGYSSGHVCQWYGPGKVVCIEKCGSHERNQLSGSIVWVAHGTTLYRCSPEQLRVVTREVENVSGLFGRHNSPSEILKDARRGQHYQDLIPDIEGMPEGDEVFEQDPEENPSLLDQVPPPVPATADSGSSAPWRVWGKRPARYYHDGPSASHRSPQPEDGQARGEGSEGPPGRIDGTRGVRTGIPKDDRRSVQGSDRGGSVQEESLLRDLVHPASVGQQEVFPLDDLCRAPSPERPEEHRVHQRRSRPSQPFRSSDQIPKADRDAFQQHSWRERDHVRLRHEQPRPDLPHREGPLRSAAEHNDRDANAQPSPAEPADSQHADPGGFDDGGIPRGSSGSRDEIPNDSSRSRSVMHRTSERGIHSPSSRLRSRSRHKDAEGAVFLNNSEDPGNLPENPVEELEDPQSPSAEDRLDLFETGCFPKGCRTVGGRRLKAKVKYGCFDWMKQSQFSLNQGKNLEEPSSFAGYSQVSDEVVEICMTVAPRDIHMKRRNGVSEWVLNQKPKKNAEVKLRKLDPAERENFKHAMKGELDSFLEKEAIEIASREGIDPRKLLGMRWVLTYKMVQNEKGEICGQKPKARKIIRGYEDPMLLSLRRDSPTLSVHSRNMLLSMCAMNGWDLFAGDVKTAFLNGDKMPEKDQLYGDPLMKSGNFWEWIKRKSFVFRK